MCGMEGSRDERGKWGEEKVGRGESGERQEGREECGRTAEKACQ